jgi:hypothetical protein
LPDQIPPSADRLIRLPALLCAGLLAGAVWTYPLGRWWLAAGLAAWLLILKRWPQAWLVLLPAALPVLDLAPWSGRFYVDEFDCMLAAAVALMSWRRIGRTPGMPRIAALACILFGLSWLVSMLKGAAPFPAPDLNSFNNYDSPYNSLRLGKGLLWAWLLWPFLRDALQRDPRATEHRFGFGMGLGVLAAALAVLWERAAFPGLLNFSSGYRVVGLFSAMHTGGAYIEAYFAIALPVLAWWTFSARGWRWRAAGALMLVAGLYALLVTYARAGYLALAVGAVVLAAGMAWRTRPAPARWAAAGLALAALLAWSALQGEAMQRRYASTEHDWRVRTAHWSDALRMMDRDLATGLFGMGIGRYPATYLARSGEAVHPGRQSIASEPGNLFLRLAAGAPAYTEQLVDYEPSRRYRLSFAARSADPLAQVALPVCEKWMLYSARCLWTRVEVGDTGGRWRAFSVELAPAPWVHPARSVKLSIFNPVPGATLDIDQLSLRNGRHELLANGDFSEGMDRWFFSADNHLPWHIENLWLQVFFEQGAFGVLALAALLACAGAALARRRKEPYAAALAAALAAFLTLAVLDSLFDFPRLGLLFGWLLAQALALPEARPRNAPM